MLRIRKGKAKKVRQTFSYFLTKKYRDAKREIFLTCASMFMYCNSVQKKIDSVRKIVNIGKKTCKISIANFRLAEIAKFAELRIFLHVFREFYGRKLSLCARVSK